MPTIGQTELIGFNSKENENYKIVQRLDVYVCVTRVWNIRYVIRIRNAHDTFHLSKLHRSNPIVINTIIWEIVDAMEWQWHSSNNKTSYKERVPRNSACHPYTMKMFPFVIVVIVVIAARYADFCGSTTEWKKKRAQSIVYISAHLFVC